MGMIRLPGVGKTIFKKDESIDFTSEQIAFANSFKDVEVEVNKNSLVITAPTGELAEKYALEIVQQYPFELKLLWSKA